MRAQGVVACCTLLAAIGCLTGAAGCATGFTSPYTLKLQSTKPVRGGLRHCFQLGAVKLSKGTECSSFTLRKVEFDTKRQCAGKMTDLEFNGLRKSPSMQWFSGGQVTKVTGNPLAQHGQVLSKPLEFCFTLKGACAKLSSFCTRPSCKGSVAFFDMALDCCPVV